MHDEPTIDFMNYVGLDTIGVGNHEFDEGSRELLRMQYGNRTRRGRGENMGSLVHAGPRRRLPSGRRLPGRNAVRGLASFQYLAANVIDTDTDNPLLPQYQIVDLGKGAKLAFIGETLQGDAADRHADRRRRAQLPRRGRHGQRARPAS